MADKLSIVEHKLAIREEIRATWRSVKRHRLLIKQIRIIQKLELYPAKIVRIPVIHIPTPLEQIPIRFELT